MSSGIKGVLRLYSWRSLRYNENAISWQIKLDDAVVEDDPVYGKEETEFRTVKEAREHAEKWAERLGIEITHCEGLENGG